MIKLKDFISYSSYDKYGQSIIDFLRDFDANRDHLKDITIGQNKSEWIIYSNNKKLTTCPLDRIRERTIKEYGLEHST